MKKFVSLIVIYWLYPLIIINLLIHIIMWKIIIKSTYSFKWLIKIVFNRNLRLNALSLFLNKTMCYCIIFPVISIWMFKRKICLKSLELILFLGGFWSSFFIVSQTILNVLHWMRLERWSRLFFKLPKSLKLWLNGLFKFIKVYLSTTVSLTATDSWDWKIIFWIYFFRE